MGIFFPVLLSTVAWALQPVPAITGQFATHRIIQAEPRFYWPVTQQQHDSLPARPLLFRIRRSPSASAVIDFQSKPTQSSTEMVSGDLLTLNNATVTVSQFALLLPLNHSLLNQSQDSETLALSVSPETLIPVTSATEASTFNLTLTSETLPLNETGTESDEEYYFDYDTETTVYEDVTTLSSHVISDNEPLEIELSSSDKTETSQMAHSYIVANNTRTVGRALSTHNEEELIWEARSTKVTSTFISDPDVEPNSGGLATGGIIAICIAVLFIVMLAGGSGYWWYRRRFTNRPESLNDRYAASEAGNSGGEDIFRVGYIHHPELPKDSSEEMYSLDNDSFLTSLEAMTIPNYWTENIKHTKL